MKIRTLSFFFLLLLIVGCAQQSSYSIKPGDAARISTDRQIKELMEGTYANYGGSEELSFSNIYTIRSVRAPNTVTWQVCSLFRGSDWEPGEYKQAHLQRGTTTITDSNALTGTCDPNLYPNKPSNFIMKSGIQDGQLTSSQEASNEPDNSQRQRVEPSNAQVEHAQNVILEMLKDPESAQFRRIYGAKGSVEKIAICGEVNAKNSYGGYTGYKQFMVFEGEDGGHVWDSNANGYSFDNMMIEEICPDE